MIFKKPIITIFERENLVGEWWLRTGGYVEGIIDSLLLRRGLRRRRREKSLTDDGERLNLRQ